MARVVFVIAPENFRDEELFHTKEEIDNAGNETAIASLRKGSCSGMLGGTAEASYSLDEITADDFDAIVFVGGKGASVYFENELALKLAKDFESKGKAVAAICIAPSILANAGLLNGRKATCFESEHANIEEKGATFTGSPVEVAGNIITANGPKAAHDFGKAIVEVL